MRIIKLILKQSIYFPLLAFTDELAKEIRSLDGLIITYEYTTSRSCVNLELDGISYRYLSGFKPDKWWGPFP